MLKLLQIFLVLWRGLIKTKGMLLDAVIFDVDGTLWDASEECIRAWDQAKRELYGEGLDLGMEELAGLFGKPMDEISQAMFPNLPRAEAIRRADHVFEKEVEWLNEHPGKVFDGVLDTMKKLKKRYRLFIVSNCQVGYIEALMKAARIEPYISGHLCFGDTNLPKSCTIRRLMEQYEIPSAVYVGDTRDDAEACRQAGIPFLFAKYGFGSAEEDYPSVSSVWEIPDAIEEIGKD